MLVFIDDSGDPSFKLDRGASKNFVICCVIFDDDLEAEKTAVAIKGLRRKLKFSDRVEFKFNGSNFQTRLAFLKEVGKYNFRIRALSIDKTKIKSGLLKNDKQSFYSYFIKTVLQYNKGTINNAKIRIDGGGDRLFRKKFLTYLRKHLNSKKQKVVDNVTLVDSKTNVLIQLADMIAGAIRRYKEGEKEDSSKYWLAIKNRIEDCWDFK